MIDILEQALVIVPQIVTAATAVTIATKSTNANPWLSIILKVLNCIAGNFGNNKNADDK